MCNYNEKSQCNICNNTPVLQSYGNCIDPTYMIIGDVPTLHDISKQQPFTGEPGILLRTSMIKYGLTKTNTILTHLMPCCPLSNKLPNKNQVTTCIDKWLLNEIQLLNPQFILLIGTNVSRYIIGSHQRIDEVRRHIFDCMNVIPPPGKDPFSDKYNIEKIMIVTYHPSYILRQSNVEFQNILKKSFDSDIRRFRNLIHNPKSLFF